MIGPREPEVSILVEVWSDVVCPWCYIGRRRFAAALARFPQRDGVRVRWRSFELDPAAPTEHDEPLTAYLAAKYGTTHAEAARMQERIRATAAVEGLDLRFDRARRGNTFDAHRLLHLAGERGLGDRLVERLFAAYFTEGAPIGSHETLTRLGADVGLDPDEAAGVLDSDGYAEAVRIDEAEARALGISGVPFFVIDRAHGVSGAQPAEVHVQVLERAWPAS